jgi:hypothetical protein
MKKIAGLLLAGLGLLYSLPAHSQTYAESALLFSRTSPGGSARIQGLGGAQVSLGGDYSSAYSNPAGLGMYNRSEITFSPGFNTSNTSSSYLGNTSNQSRGTFVIPGFSAVFHSEKNNGALLGGTFGITFNRINDFNKTFSYGGTNQNNSIIDYFVQDATGYDSTQFDPPTAGNNYVPGAQYEYPTGLAYYNYLINPVPGSPTNYFTDILTVPVQHETVQTKGSQNQWNFSYGVNLKDKYFIGLGVGINSISYTSTKTYSESFPNDPYLNSLSLTESLSTKGSGINLTLGTIIKPIDILQFGVSIVTPSAYLLSDSYSASMSTNWHYFPYGAANIPPVPVTHDQVLTDYNLNTPWRVSGGATFFFQKNGFITADVEYLNYGSNRYSSQTDGVTFDSDNADIKDLYKAVFNYRVGAEYRLNTFRFRVGYNLMPDPYKTVQNNVSASVQSVSAGVGYRTSKFFVDLAAVFKQGNSTYRPYVVDSPSSPLVTTKNTNSQVILTFGVPF